MSCQDLIVQSAGIEDRSSWERQMFDLYDLDKDQNARTDASIFYPPRSVIR